MQIFRQILGHPLGQRGDQCPVSIRRNAPDLIQQIVDLHLHRPDLDLRIQKAGRADDLFGKDAAGLLHLPIAGGGRDIDRLRAHCVPFLELQRAVVHAGRQAEPMFRQGELAPIVAPVHAADLGNGHMGFVSENNGIVGDELEQRRRRLPRCAPRQIARIILDPVADARGLQHLDIEIRPLLQPLRLQQLALVHQLGQPFLQLFLDRHHRLLHRRLRRHVMRIRIDPDLVETVRF